MPVTELTLPQDLLERVAARIEQETGLFFPPGRRLDLQVALGRIIRAMGAGTDERACAAWLAAAPWDRRTHDLCVQHLTIGETYFFREPRAFDLVRDYTLRALQANAARRVRIWSAGCCTGEEAYSIAIALKEALPADDWERVSILATDLNRHALQRARDGAYRQWSFRTMQDGLRARYFTRCANGTFRIDDALRAKVDFAELNLASAAFPAAENGTLGIDIIFCRNVLMYFSQPQMRAIVGRLRACLVPGGWLVVSPTEASCDLFEGFSGHCYPDAIHYQKEPEAAPRKRPPPMSLPAPVAPAVPAPRRRPLRSAAAPARRAEVRDRPGAANPAAAARALVSNGRVLDAVALLEQATSASPLHPELHYIRAEIALEGGDIGTAVKSLKRALYLDPEFILARYLLGMAKSAQGRRTEARRQFEAVDELLRGLDDDETIAGSDGLHVAYLREAVRSMLHKEND